MSTSTTMKPVISSTHLEATTVEYDETTYNTIEETSTINSESKRIDSDNQYTNNIKKYVVVNDKLAAREEFLDINRMLKKLADE